MKDKRKTYRIFFSASGYLDIEARNAVAAEAAFEERLLCGPNIEGGVTSVVIDHTDQLGE